MEDMTMAILPLNEDIFPLSEDYVFKAVLTRPDTKPALMDLISAVIGRTVTDVVIRNNELPASDSKEKNERLDINCTIDDGSQVDVEMQGAKGIKGGRTALINKSIYYLTDLHSSQESKGKDYISLVRTYQITFCMHSLFDSKGYITEAALRTQDGTQVSDQIQLTFIELNKLDDVLTKTVEDMTSLEMWSIFLGYSDDRKKRDLVNKVLEQKEVLGMAGTVLKEVSKDEHERAKRMSQRKWETDYTNDMIVSRREGKAEGIAEGKAEGIAEGKAEGIAVGKAEGKVEGAALLAKLITEGTPLEDALKQIKSETIVQ